MKNEEILGFYEGKSAYFDSFLDMMELFYGRNDQELLDLVNFLRNHDTVDIIFVDCRIERVFIIHPFLKYADEFLNELVSLKDSNIYKPLFFRYYPDLRNSKLYALEYSLN